MTIHLPKELESSILAQVHSGHFASLDDAMTQAARLLLRQLEQGDKLEKPVINFAEPKSALGSIGAMRDVDDELSEIVDDAVRRWKEPWRVIAHK
jgi:Arc/MetJ-type ribon-helix-helix transcriptional regulator